MESLRPLTIVLAAATVVGAIAVGDALARPSASVTRTVSVTGVGTATAAPDTFSFSVDVVTGAPTTAAALAANDARVTALDHALAALRVTRRDLATTSLSVNPTYDGHGNITGYQVDDQVTVTSHQVAHAGAILGAAVAAAGNPGQISALTFSVSNQSAARARARTDAILAAARAARTLARAAGTTVGRVISIVDEENASPIVIPEPVFAAAGVRAPSVPVSPGTQVISVTVKVVDQLG